MADLEVRIYGRGSPPSRFPVGPVQTLQATAAGETLRIAANTVTATIDEGLATQYPGDVGIEADPDVIFVERFEQATTAAVIANWGDGILTGSFFSPDVPSGSPGLQSLGMKNRDAQNTAVPALLFKNMGALGLGPLYARAYFKYPAFCQHGGIWVGGNFPRGNFPYVPAGTLPPTADSDDNWFSAGAEIVDATGRLEHYCYWPNMRPDGSPGGGSYWGNWLLMDPNITVNFNEWFCLEVMLKPNDPITAFNGEHAIWLNGVKVSHLRQGAPNGSWNFVSGTERSPFTQNPAGPTPFEGFKWRTITELEPNWIWLQAYNGANPCTVYVDHVVVAKRYIGLLTASSSVVFTWDAVSGADSYQLEIGTTSGGTETAVIDVGNVLTTTRSLSSGTYYSRVRAIDGGVLGSASDELTIVVP